MLHVVYTAAIFLVLSLAMAQVFLGLQPAECRTITRRQVYLLRAVSFGLWLWTAWVLAHLL